MKINQINHKNA